MSDELDRQKLIEEKVRAMDEVDRIQTEAVREEMFRFLTEHRGYSPENIEKDLKFKVSISGCEDYVSTDYIINFGGRRFMAIKCASGSVDSRERHITAFSRVVDEYQIPFCLVTDGENTRLIDTASGDVLSEDLLSVPAKEEALKQIESVKFSSCPPERLEKEKRILLAFETVKCPNVKT